MTGIEGVTDCANSPFPIDGAYCCSNDLPPVDVPIKSGSQQTGEQFNFRYQPTVSWRRQEWEPAANVGVNMPVVDTGLSGFLSLDLVH